MDEQQQTFEEVIEENKSRIYRICSIYAVSPISAEDLFQEVTIGVWKSYPSFQGKASIDTWVYRIALNVCMRSKDRLQRSNQKTLRLESILFEPAQAESSDEKSEQLQALTQCMHTLSEPDRSIVILSLEGLPYRKIAEITGLNENHIAVKMKRIRKNLLHCINLKMRTNER